MKSRRKILLCILMACMGTAIGFSASINAMDVKIAPPPRPASSTEIKPGESHQERDKVRHGHHHKGDVKKSKSMDDEDVKGGRS
ncbi:hypothetical protein [Paraherbaspirillum soli]|uniref:Uncharacterized protein n=1 Tax=Paraherbaspirillum soli TaxID=631222 RepID=A0ABW0M3M0_9BURK